MWPNNPPPANFQPGQKFPQYPVQQSAAHPAALQRDGVVFSGSSAPDSQIMGPPPPKTPHIQNAMPNMMQHQRPMNTMFLANGLPSSMGLPHRTPANNSQLSENQMLNGLSTSQFHPSNQNHPAHGRMNTEPKKFDGPRQFPPQNMPQQEISRPWMSSPSQQQPMKFISSGTTQNQQQLQMINMKTEKSPNEDRNSPRVKPAMPKSLPQHPSFNSNPTASTESPPFGSGLPTPNQQLQREQCSQFWPSMPPNPAMGFGDKLGITPNSSLPLPNASQLLSNLSAVPNGQQNGQPSMNGDEKSTGSEKPKRKRRKRCGQCEPCHIKEDCGVCYVCKNKGQAELEGMEGSESIDTASSTDAPMTFRPLQMTPSLNNNGIHSNINNQAPVSQPSLPPSLNTMEQKNTVIQRHNSAPTFNQHSKPEQHAEPSHHPQMMTPWGSRYQPKSLQHGHHVNQSVVVPPTQSSQRSHPGPGRPKGSTTKTSPVKNRSFSGVSEVFKVFKDDMQKMNERTFIHANGVKVCKLMAKMLELNITDEELKSSQPPKPAPFAWDEFVGTHEKERRIQNGIQTITSSESMEEEEQPIASVITTTANNSLVQNVGNISSTPSSSKLDSQSAEQSDVDETTQPAASDPAGVDSGFSSSSPAERQSPSPPNKVTFHLPHQPTNSSSSSAEVIDVKPHRSEDITVAVADSTQASGAHASTPHHKSPAADGFRRSPTSYSAMSSLSDLTASISDNKRTHAATAQTSSGNIEQSHSYIDSLDRDLTKTHTNTSMFNSESVTSGTGSGGRFNVPHPFSQMIHGMNNNRPLASAERPVTKSVNGLPQPFLPSSNPLQQLSAAMDFPQTFQQPSARPEQSPLPNTSSDINHPSRREALPTPRMPEHFHKEAGNLIQNNQTSTEGLAQPLQKQTDGSQINLNNHFFKHNLPAPPNFNSISTQPQMSCEAIFQNRNQQTQSMPMMSNEQTMNPIQSIVSSLTNQVMGGTENQQKQPEDSQSLLKNNKIAEPPPCSCNTRPHDETVDGPFYIHLGHASSIANIRKLMENRMGISGNALRIEKVKFTMKEGKTSLGCPAAKWIIRRTGIEEKCLTIIKHRPGHNCDTAWIIVSIVAWEGVPQMAADHMYSYLTRVLPVYGYETERRCGTNQPRDCACQGWDTNRKGASFSFGCSWSVYYNGCKFARSQVPRKFKLRDDSFEGVLESKFQALGQHLAPLYRQLAPQSYGGQVRYERQAGDCRIGFRTGRPFSGCTAVVDFCAHQHRDTHNMNNGCTVVVTLTKHRGLSKPDDEQLHTLPLYILEDTDEYGTKEGIQARIRNGGLEILDRYSEEQRRRSRPYKKKKKGGETYQSPKVKQAYMQTIEEKKLSGAEAAKNNLFIEQRHNVGPPQNTGPSMNNFPPSQSQGANHPQSFSQTPPFSQPKTVEQMMNAPLGNLTNQNVPLGSLSNQNTPPGGLPNQGLSHPHLANQMQQKPFNPLNNQLPSMPNQSTQQASFNPMNRFQQPSTPLPSFQSMSQQPPSVIGQPAISSTHQIPGQPGLPTPTIKQEKTEALPEPQKGASDLKKDEDEACQLPKPRPPSPEFDDPDGQDVHDDNAHLFRDPMVGGVAIALHHGSVLFEVAKRELHATTALRQPDRYNPTRISLVFYQHKRLNFKKHGFLEYQKAEEERQKARKEAEAQGLEYIPKGLKYKKKRQQEAEARNFEKKLGIIRNSSKFYPGVIKKKPGRKPGVKKKAKIRFAAYQYLWPQAVNHTFSSATPTVVTSWMKPACIVTGPYQKWVSLHQNQEAQNQL